MIKIYTTGGSIDKNYQTLPDGVYVVMNGRAFDPRRSRKNLDLDRFEDSP